MIYKDYLFTKRLPMMQKALNTYALRQKVLAKNIANTDTPNYRPQEVKFEEFFHKEEIVLKGAATENNHFSIGNNSPNIPDNQIGNTDIPEPEIFMGGENHLNIDEEMAKTAENQIRFRLMSKMVNKYFTEISGAIKGINQ